MPLRSVRPRVMLTSGDQGKLMSASIVGPRPAHHNRPFVWVTGSDEPVSASYEQSLSLVDRNRDCVGGRTSGLVGARWGLAQRVPAGGERAGPRAPAQVGVLAAAAAAAEVGSPD